MDVKDFIIKCDRLPILITIEGNGCLEVYNEGLGNRNRICGPGIGVLTNIKVGIVKILAIPDEGLDITNLIGLPKTQNTRYAKPYYQFYYDGRYFNEKTKSGNMLEIKAIFRKAPDVTPAPDGNALGV